VQRDIFLDGEGDAWFRRNRDGDPLAVLDRLARHVLPDASILEVGCGDGRNLARLPGSGNRAGVDPSTLAIAAGSAEHPEFDLRVGTAEAVPFRDPFDVVLFGFCLYLCDRQSLPRIIAEADRLLIDGGTLAILDFDPPFPRRRQYRHREGVLSWKVDYASIFLAYPSYSLVEKVSTSHEYPGWVPREGDRVALWVLRKELELGYGEEPDE
jgi:SAM-dependent methyltransferase